jgi:hypothetical protein
VWSRCPTLRRLFLLPSSTVYVMSVLFARSSGQSPMMETVSETSDTNSTLTWLIAQEDFVVHCHPEGFKSYVTVEHIPGSYRSPKGHEIWLRADIRICICIQNPAIGWSSGNALELVFGLCSVRISAGIPAHPRFSWLSSVPQGKFRDSTSVRLRQFPSKSFSFHPSSYHPIL